MFQIMQVADIKLQYLELFLDNFKEHVGFEGIQEMIDYIPYIIELFHQSFFIRYFISFPLFQLKLFLINIEHFPALTH